MGAGSQGVAGRACHGFDIVFLDLSDLKGSINQRLKRYSLYSSGIGNKKEKDLNKKKS